MLISTVLNWFSVIYLLICYFIPRIAGAEQHLRSLGAFHLPFTNIYPPSSLPPTLPCSLPLSSFTLHHSSLLRSLSFTIPLHFHITFPFLYHPSSLPLTLPCSLPSLFLSTYPSLSLVVPLPFHLPFPVFYSPFSLPLNLLSSFLPSLSIHLLPSSLPPSLPFPLTSLFISTNPSHSFTPSSSLS
jgi:hypothetical protein